MKNILDHITEDVKKILDSKHHVSVSGVLGSFMSFILASVYKNSSKNIIFISDSCVDSASIRQDLETFIPKEEILSFPSWEVGFDEEISPHIDIIEERVLCLNNLAFSSKNKILITSAAAICHQIFSEKYIKNSVVNLIEGDTYLLEDLLSSLVSLSYERVEKVEKKGEFAVRGGIVDVFAIGYDDPLRIEFFGDDIDSIRSFDFATQRSLKKINSFKILPCLEKEILEQISKDGKSYICDYFKDDAIVFFKEPLRYKEVLSKLGSNETFENIKNIFVKNKYVFLSFLDEKLEKNIESYNFKIESIDLVRNDIKILKNVTDKFKSQCIDLYYFCSNDVEKKRLREVLIKEKFIKKGEEDNIVLGYLSKGFVCADKKIAIISYEDIFRGHKIQSPRRVIKHSNNVPVYNISDLKEGDYIVHISHGIGIFQGLKRMEHDGVEKDYLILEYKDGDILYVPIEQIDLIQKYIGLEKSRPSLHKLGGKAWSQTKEDTKIRIKNMAKDLLNVQAKRSVLKGYAFSKDNSWQRDFEEAFLFTETDDQKIVIEEIKKDMQSGKPMDRLLCGDVGFGKTEVAIRAAFKAVVSGKQVAILVPTTVLAQQHYNTFTDRMAGFPIKVEMLSRFKTRKEQRDIIEEVKMGNVDIVIGTHRLIQDDISFKDLGLLVIDEEQRFGVGHKEKIKRLRTLVDVLTMTATPLPRTLYMSLTGIRDMSSLNTPPEDRLPVHTQVIHYNEDIIKKAIDRELAREGQVFFLHNRVQSINKVADKIQKMVPYAKIGIGHGQMNEHELEAVMYKFVNGEYDILVCTTIIESGLDISNANTIFIDRADMFGLADLYQLRGRVGRSKHRAYAYFLIDEGKFLSKDAQERLSAINEFSALGSGYRIALKDLELRGAGNVLGQEQSGCIVRVGFDMYCNLLRRTVKELKGEAPEFIPAVVDLRLDLTIGEDYIFDLNQRLEVYRKIAGAANEKEIKDVLNEIKDRFGKKVPKEIKLLVEISKLKIVAGMKGINYIGRRNEFLDVISEDGHRVVKLNCDEQEKKERLIEKAWSVLGN